MRIEQHPRTNKTDFPANLTAERTVNHWHTVVIGGGQAGLATSYCLKKKQHAHIVLERSKQVANTWRNERWDSFCLVTQNWSLNLPGFPYDGDQPEGFILRDEIVAYLERYAASFDPPLRLGVEVTQVGKAGGEDGYILSTPEETIHADQVVVATGTFQHPRIPAFAENIDPGVRQIHTREYRNAAGLPAGSVLVVGSGQSGCQIVEDLLFAGRKVYLTVGKAPRAPRRYRGKDILQWVDLAGMYDLPIYQHPQGMAVRFNAHAHLSGRDGGRTINLREFGRQGVVLLGRFQGANGSDLSFADDLVESLNAADEGENKLRKMVDDYIINAKLSVAEEPRKIIDFEPKETILQLDLEKENITSIVWATGFRYDFSWIKLPIFDERGYPIYRRGVTQAPGFYFVGLHWMYQWGSGLFYGLGRDAEYIADKIAST